MGSNPTPRTILPVILITLNHLFRAREHLESGSRFPDWIINREDLKPGLTVGEALELKKYVEDHLRSGYPEIYNDLLEYRKLRCEFEGEENKEIRYFINMVNEKKGKVKILNYKIIRSGSWYRKLFPKTVVEIEEEKVIGPFDVGSEDEKRFINIERKMSQELLDDYFELEDKLEQIQIRLGGNIQLLLRKIDNGIPLEGNCDLCPRFKIGK